MLIPTEAPTGESLKRKKVKPPLITVDVMLAAMKKLEDNMKKDRSVHKVFLSPRMFNEGVLKGNIRSNYLVTVSISEETDLLVSDLKNY